MFSPSVELTKDGVIVHTGGEAEPWAIADIGDLMHLWHWRLEGIDPEFTLGDLAHLLRSLHDDVDVLGWVLNTPVQAILDYAGGGGRAAECPLRYLEVCNVAIPTRYEPDPANPDVPLQVIVDDGAGGIPEDTRAVLGEVDWLIGVSSPDSLSGNVAVMRVVSPKRRGAWSGPYHVMRTLRGWGLRNPAFPAPAGAGGEPVEGGCSLFFAVLPDIAHLPLRYNPELVFGAGETEGEPPVTRQVAITVGELLRAVFWELGFNGVPEDRVAMRAAVRERFGEFTEGEGPAIAWHGVLE